MGSWSERQEVKKEVKEKEKISRETLGKFFYDLAKTSFAAMVAGGAVSFFTSSNNELYLAFAFDWSFFNNSICLYWL